MSKPGWIFAVVFLSLDALLAATIYRINTDPMFRHHACEISYSLREPLGLVER